MWDLLQDVARNITLVLDHGGGSHRKCPKCRGSGLLVDNSLIKWMKNEAQSNQPCWFCEGIGVLPIAGLNGFLLARANPCLTAVDKHQCYFEEISHLGDCSYGKKKIKFMKRKLGVFFADLLFDCKAPEKNEDTNCVKTSLEIEQDLREISRFKKGKMRSCKWEQTLQVNSGLGLLLVSRSESSEHVLETPLDYSPVHVLHPSAELRLSSPFTSALLALHMNKTADYSCLGHYLRVGSGSRLSFTQRTAHTVPVIALKDKGIVVSGQNITIRPNWQAKSCIVCAKRQRPVRKMRNRIREKAVKEAMERARGIVRGLKFQNVEDSVFAVNYQQSECQNPIVHGPLLPMGMATNTTGVAEYQKFWLHQRFFPSFKALMPCLKYESNSKATAPRISPTADSVI